MCLRFASTSAINSLFTFWKTLKGRTTMLDTQNYTIPIQAKGLLVLIAFWLERAFRRYVDVASLSAG